MGSKATVYRILSLGWRVSISIVPDVSPESITTETVKRVRRGSIVYTDGCY